MKKILTRYLFYCLLTCVICSSCRKKEETHSINSELKRHFSFKEGTYWVYEDTATGKLDTFTVTDNHTSIVRSSPPDAPYAKEVQVMNTKLNGDNSGQYSLFYRLGGENVGVYFDNLRVVFGVDYSIYSIPSSLTNVDAGTMSFDSVVKVTTNKSVCYIKKDVGMVKVLLVTDTSVKAWILKEWSIVK